MISSKTEQSFDSPPEPARKPSSDIRATYDDRLNHILKAATEVIARMGYQRASMRAVAKAAGTSLAGMYHYFDSKEKMLFLIQFRTFTSLLNNLREKLHGVDDSMEQLRLMIRAHVAYFAANMEDLKVCSHEMDSLTGEAYEETRRVRREYYKLSRSVVERVIRECGDGSSDPRMATMGLFSMLNWLYRWYDPKRDRSPNALAAQITELFLRGVMGANAANANKNDDSPTGAAASAPTRT